MILMIAPLLQLYAFVRGVGLVQVVQQDLAQHVDLVARVLCVMFRRFREMRRNTTVEVCRRRVFRRCLAFELVATRLSTSLSLIVVEVPQRRRLAAAIWLFRCCSPLC